MELTSQPSAAPTPARKRVALLIGASAALVLSQFFLAIFLSQRKLVPVAWFVPAALAFYFGAALSIALLSFGRFLFRKEPYAFWAGLGFWISALFNLAQLVFLDSAPNPTDSDAAYFFYLSYLALLFPAFFLLAKTPRPKVFSWRPLAGRLVWLSLSCALLAAAIFVATDRLPPLVLSARAAGLSRALLYGAFLLYVGAVIIHWRRFNRTREPMVGYVLGFLLLCLWVFLGLILSREPYDFAWFSSYLFPIAGCLFFYLALLLEYLDLYRELDATVEQSQRHATIQSLLKEVTQDITTLDVNQLVQKLTSKVCAVLKVDVSDVRLMAGGAWQSVGVSGIEPSRLQSSVTGSGLRRSRVVIESRKPVAVEDMSLEAPVRQGNRSIVLGFRGYVGVPLFKRNGEVVGVLRVLTYKPRHFSPDDVDLLQQLANGAAIAIENAQLLEEARQKSLHLEALIKVNRDVASLLKKEFLLPSIANEARRFLNVDGASFRLIEGKTLVRAGFAGEEELLALTPVMPLGESVTGKIVRENRVIAVKNVRHDPVMVEKHRRILGESGYHSFLGVPLRLGSRVIGTINLYSKQEREFRLDEIQMITAFADQTAIAVENARLFEELQQKSGELEDAFRTKTDFLNTMAHELRTPLNVVIGTQQLLLEGSYGALGDEQSKALERIGRYAQDLLGLINEILDLVRLDARKVPVHTSEFSVREITDDLEIFFAPLAREKGLDLKFDIGAALPSLKSDRAKIKEILQNLLANALKYTEKGKIELNVALQSRNSTSQGKRVSLSVRDTGIGIGQSDLAHLFEPFYMADGVDRRKYPGSGLGLSIVKRLVELLDGDIKIESELCKGSTFTVTFPLDLSRTGEK